MEVVNQKDLKCFHCGDSCNSDTHFLQDKPFCCTGCQTVYQILTDNQLGNYYELQNFPGSPQSPISHKYDFLDNSEIAGDVLNFASDSLHKVQFYIPNIHCSSCIWLLERLPQLERGILGTRVNFTRKELAVDYDPTKFSLRKLVELLARIGYEPNISLESPQKMPRKGNDQVLATKIGVAGFCFGNIMLLSFPEYLGLDLGTDQFLSIWFSWLMLGLALPVIFYCASVYFQSAAKGVQQRYLNIDVPIVLGILALFGLSLYEIIAGTGPGYLDSLAGLIFLLLIGKWFQEKTYRGLSFDRDFKAYFPMAACCVRDGQEKSVLVSKLKAQDVIRVRHEEIIPADSILLAPHAQIDYSFVTGESEPVVKHAGDSIYAGGKHLGVRAQYQVVNPISESYLTQLWNHRTFQTSKDSSRSQLINSISRYFTVTILAVALSAALYWLLVDNKQSLFVFTSVLIVACPCALSMATPFTLGSAMRIMGMNRLYLRNASVVEDLAQINHLIFDKTGTLTKPQGLLDYHGPPLQPDQVEILFSLAAQSKHPVSEGLRSFLEGINPRLRPTGDILDFDEVVGQGISAMVKGKAVAIGTKNYVTGTITSPASGVHIAIEGRYLGFFEKKNQYRNGLGTMFKKLTKRYPLSLLSGDGSGEKGRLRSLFSLSTLLFNQSPQAKLDFVQRTQKDAKVLMVGDGLNDAGALKQSDVGIALSESDRHFTPASDGIISGRSLVQLPEMLRLARWSRKIIIWGFALSFLYNLVGLGLAVSAKLTPLTAAVLMPLSSISVVLFTTVCVYAISKYLKLQ